MEKALRLRMVLFVLIFLTSIHNIAEGATFVGICMPVKSQIIELDTLLVGLADKGHEVYIVMGEHPSVPPLPKNVIDSKVKLLTFKVRSPDFMDFEKPEVQKNGVFAFFDNPRERYIPIKGVAFVNNWTKILHGYFGDLLTDEDFDRKMTKLKPDMIIVNNAFAFAPTAYLFPYKYKIPYVTSAVLGPPESGVPQQASFLPSPITKYSDQMTFLQRTVNFMTHRFISIMTTHKISPDYYAKYLPNVIQKPFHQLVADSELFIITSKHPSIDYPQLALPNTIFAGGMMTRPGKPLPNELQNFMDGHKNGVVVVTFGSLAMYIPDQVIQKLLSAFSKIKYAVIWRYTGSKKLNLPSHVKVLPWLPQNDLLAHPNTKLFVSHCGNGGSYEALYHGIPVLGFPLMGDQFYNGYRGQHRGVAMVMDILYFTPEELIENINTMIENSSYYTKAKKLSAIYRDQPWTPQQQAAYWIEHVLKHGGSYLRSPSAHMSWYQYYSVDVVVFLLSIFACIVVAFISCCKCLCRRCCKGEGNKQNKIKTK
ncbi:UDP-glucuronosyltransferase 2C1 [Lingula anatina]|uniref:UDP-glucuronosyltransferase 2C1 n=1 Tax=Lingula anatina TaxID=7574 RepID=A0A1S3H3R1_LINAN|nr:UDP-glucuronosyltransferase 2C1 [Lingula anatina]|eukprot:XP_013380643.1 UDP-glucuronosyltransferase 2C1 [Lingula anatina]